MICRSCRTTMLSRLQQTHAVSWIASTAARQLPIVRNQYRFYSDKAANPSVAATPPPSAPRQATVGDNTTPSAISSATPGVSQPLSTPEGVHTDAKPASPTKPVVERPPSSCPAGTKMNGLNYFKNKPDIVAKEDSEYPDWLWDLLGDASKQSKTDKGGVDPSSKYSHQLKEKLFLSNMSTTPQPLTRSNESATRRNWLLAPDRSPLRFPPTITLTISHPHPTTATDLRRMPSPTPLPASISARR